MRVHRFFFYVVEGKEGSGPELTPTLPINVASAFLCPFK